MDEYIRHEKLTRSYRRSGLRAALGLLLLLGIPVAGQSPQFPSSITNRMGQHNSDSNIPFGQDANSPDQKRLRLLNAERQKQLISDTQKLLRLARELNEEVAESGSTSMSDGQLRKVAEIGKLARSVKERMRYSMGAYPDVNAPLTTSPGVQ